MFVCKVCLLLLFDYLLNGLVAEKKERALASQQKEEDFLCV